jgi:peptidoglycan/xylan/chitin deacetylase (PgdA/CDA1 family)
MDGTASLIYLLAAKESESKARFSKEREFRGAIVRGDSTKKNIALVFTGDEFADGGNFIIQSLEQQKVKASFFFTGRFYRNASFKKIILGLKAGGHYLGPHSDGHLLYCDWSNRDSLLIGKEQFRDDLLQNYTEMRRFGIEKENAGFFLPPYEWYNDTIAAWTKEMGLELINLSPGTLSAADYTTPEMKNYRDNETIYNSILDYEKNRVSGLNGFILLLHIGTDPKRVDKFYVHLPGLLRILKAKGYHFQSINQLLKSP